MELRTHACRVYPYIYFDKSKQGMRRPSESEMKSIKVKPLYSLIFHSRGFLTDHATKPKRKPYYNAHLQYSRTYRSHHHILILFFSHNAQFYCNQFQILWLSKYQTSVPKARFTYESSSLPCTLGPLLIMMMMTLFLYIKLYLRTI